MYKSKLIGIKYLIAVIFLLGCENTDTKTSLNNYVPYTPFVESEDFQIDVNGTKVFVAKEDCFGDRTFNTSQFFVDGKTTVEITSSEPIKNFEIRPYHLKIKANKEGNKLTFSVDKPHMMLVTINEFEPLCLFQTPPETDIPNPKDPNVIYFPKGTHEAGIIEPKEGQIIYLEQGALVKGRIYGENVENISVIGRGILDARGFTSKADKICGIEFKNSNNIKVDGIGLRSGEWWQTLFLVCNNVEVSNMNLMSFGLNNDGIDIDGVSNFKAFNNWIGCGDDGFGWHAVSAEENGEPPTKNAIAENCVIYNTHAGNGLRVGASMETQLFEDIIFRDITVFAHANAAIRSDHSDWAKIKNLRFENFYIEQPGRPIEIRIEKTEYSNSTGYKDERGHINGLYFKNVFAPSGDIILEGYDQTHLIENIRFSNCKIGNDLILNTSCIKKNDFVENISFEAGN